MFPHLLCGMCYTKLASGNGEFAMIFFYKNHICSAVLEKIKTERMKEEAEEEEQRSAYRKLSGGGDTVVE